MSTHGGWAAGLAFLPDWLTDARDAPPFDSLFGGWAQASGWRAAGVIWPAEAPHTFHRVARVNPGAAPPAPPVPGVLMPPHTPLPGTNIGAGVGAGISLERPATAPAELADLRASLEAGAPTALWQMPNSAGRLYTLLSPPGRGAGVLWVERGGEPWTDAERHYLRLSAKLIERSPALAACVGPLIDPERLHQRLGDAAVIAGRMAHDFDNILTGIIGFADLSVPLLPAGSQQAKFLAEIGKVGQRGIVFTQQLHQLSRSGQGKPLPGSLGNAVAKEEARLKAALAPGAWVHAHVSPHLAHVAMEPAPLTAVVGHVLANAIEATPASGEVRVAAEMVELSPTEARAFLGHVAPGPHVQLTVEDTGPGIKPEVRAKLFVDPFYTTKVRHRGLGLAIVYRTLCAHRGGIRIDSPLPAGKGTRVRVVIPPAAVRPAVAPNFAPSPLIGG